MSEVNKEIQVEVQALIAERKTKLPKQINPPLRDNTAVLLPMMDGRLHFACAQGLIESVPFYGGLFDIRHGALITLVRNRLINGFLTTPFQWAVMIDSDIGFTKDDFQYLIDGCGSIMSPSSLIKPDSLEDDIIFACNAPYAQKNDLGKVTTRGLGFACVHRSVLELIRTEIAFPFEHEGIQMSDFFITGATATRGFLGEDSGFWWLCSQVGVIPRMERRCKLQHWGTQVYTVNELEFLSEESMRMPQGARETRCLECGYTYGTHREGCATGDPMI